MKSILGCGARQANFRSTFTPTRNYVFSRIQLKYLHTNVAKLLVSIFSNISSTPDSSYALPRTKGQTRHCTMYILPYLFGEKPIKSHVLPLGSQCDKTLNVNSKCDYVCVAQEDAEWNIFEGCWHSFHKECLSDMDYCPICSSHLNNVILSLSKSASFSFIYGGSEEYNEPANNIDDDSESDEDSNDEIECDNLGISTNESHIENIIKTINFSVMQLGP